MKNVILKRIAIIFAAATLIATAIVWTGSEVFYNNFTLNRAGMLSASAARLYSGEITASGFPQCYEDPDQSETEHLILHSICKSFRLRYMYVYTLDLQTDERCFYAAAAGDDNENVSIAVSFSKGTRTGPPYQSEKDVFLGVKDIGFETVDNEYGNVCTWYYPYKDSSGSIVALIGVDYNADEVHGMANKNTYRMVITVLVTLAVTIVAMMLILHKQIFRPIKKLSVRMDRYVPNDEFRADEIKSVGEIHDICLSFEKMSGEIRNYIDDIQKMTEEKAQAGAELNVARHIQYGMVPHDFSLEGEFFAADAFAEAAKEIGGDFYDCFTVESKVFAVMGDVSGKGVAAALFMSMAKNIIRGNLKAGQSPAKALNSANNELCEQNPEGMFVTVFAAVLDTDTGELCYANAGHTYPVLLRDEPSLLEPEKGIILGLFEDPDIKDEFIMLKGGEGLLLYTDGATEAVSINKEFFGEERLIAAVAGLRNNAAHAAAEAVLEFEKGCDLFDDLTLLSLVFKGQKNFTEKQLTCSLDAFDEMKDDIIDIVGRIPVLNSILLACEEIFVNIVSYSGSEDVRVQCTVHGDRLIVRFEDGGKAFDPINTELPEKKFDDLDTGGMGIRLVKHITLSAEYKRVNDRNILKLVFDISRHTEV